MSPSGRDMTVGELRELLAVCDDSAVIRWRYDGDLIDFDAYPPDVDALPHAVTLTLDGSTDVEYPDD